MSVTSKSKYIYLTSVGFKRTLPFYWHKATRHKWQTSCEHLRGWFSIHQQWCKIDVQSNTCFRIRLCSLRPTFKRLCSWMWATLCGSWWHRQRRVGKRGWCCDEAWQNKSNWHLHVSSKWAWTGEISHSAVCVVLTSGWAYVNRMQ